MAQLFDGMSWNLQEMALVEAACSQGEHRKALQPFCPKESPCKRQKCRAGEIVGQHTGLQTATEVMCLVVLMLAAAAFGARCTASSAHRGGAHRAASSTGFLSHAGCSNIVRRVQGMQQARQRGAAWGPAAEVHLLPFLRVASYRSLRCSASACSQAEHIQVVGRHGATPLCRISQQGPKDVVGL